jgi:cell shape-determining protein MreC
MELKQNRSIGLIIRRFFAIFILFSTASGIVAQIETGTFTNETFGSAFVSLLIAYYLARSPRNKTQSSKMDVKGNNDELSDEIQMEELLEEFEESLEEMESEEIQTNYQSERVNKRNPVKDGQSILSRIFQGKTDRY